ncbi:MAG: VOC family protein [Verrucomicrobia bacterium]|nr:VOC family protein [Verrucomicrobiota bacterium]
MASSQYQPEHFGLAARQPAVLARWYQAVLDATVVWNNGQEPPACLLRLGNDFLIEIYPAEAAPPVSAPNSIPGWRHLALRVESLEVCQAELLSRGVTFPDPVKAAGGGGRVLFFRDPEGNLIHLVERVHPGTFM